MSEGGEGGRTAWKALSSFARSLSPSGLGIVDDREKIRQLFIAELIQGGLHVKGYRAPIKPTSKPEAVPAHCWNFLFIDIPSNKAAGGGLEYHDLRFYEAAPDSKASKSAKSTMKVRADCLDWLIEEMKTPKKRYKTDYEADALNDRFPGLKERQFRELWRDAMNAPTTDSSWKKRGSLPSG